MTARSSLDRGLTLHVALPNGSRQEVFVQHGLTIGRTDANTVCIDHPDVERIHARVRSQPDGTFVLECQTDNALLAVDGDGATARTLALAPGVTFRIGPAALTCSEWQSRETVKFASSPWQVRCPRCHASLADVPQSARECPCCSLAVVHVHRPAEAKEEQAVAFTGWLPSQVGPYAIRSFVAEGGMGIVLRGLDQTNDRFAAVKLLQLSDDPGAQARFLGEIANVARCVHPNIVRLQDSGRDQHLTWLALDWVDGRPLAAHISTAKKCGENISIESIGEWMSQIAKGLAYLHERDIVHRDLKPGNVLVGQDGLVKITDFSIAKDRAVEMTAMTRTGTVAGTAGYMSPEQLDGRRAGRETDIFAFGTLWYEQLLLRRPVGTYQSVRTKRPECPPHWDDLIARCLQFDPHLRPTTDELIGALRGHSPHEAPRKRTVPPPMQHRPKKPAYGPLQMLKAGIQSAAGSTNSQTPQVISADIAGAAGPVSPSLVNFRRGLLGIMVLSIVLFKFSTPHSTIPAHAGWTIGFTYAALLAVGCLRRGIAVVICRTALVIDAAGLMISYYHVANYVRVDPFTVTLVTSDRYHFSTAAATSILVLGMALPIAARISRAGSADLTWHCRAVAGLIVWTAIVFGVETLFEIKAGIWFWASAVVSIVAVTLAGAVALCAWITEIEQWVSAWAKRNHDPAVERFSLSYALGRSIGHVVRDVKAWFRQR